MKHFLTLLPKLPTLKHTLAQAALCLMALLPMLANASEEIIYFDNDPFGNPVAATDANGNVVWKANYKPYGEQINNQAASANNHVWFHGKPFEPNTGLSYFGARYYDPVLGRFMGVDPVDFREDNIHSFNRYAYGNNNPYKFRDPDGKMPLVIVPVMYMVTNAVISGGFNAATQYLMNGSVQWGGVGGVLDAAGDGAILAPLGMMAAARNTAATSSEAIAIAKEMNILRMASNGKGNFSLGEATAGQANTLGKAWAGEGAILASDKKTLVSTDGLRQYRPPSPKPNSSYATTGVQANFESRDTNKGGWQSNGHLNITGE